MTEGVGGVIEKLLSESMANAHEQLARSNNSGMNEISEKDFENFIHSLETTTPTPMVPGVKKGDVWSWIENPADLTMLAIMLLCGRDE